MYKNPLPVASVGLKGQPRNRKVANVTNTKPDGIGTILFDAGVYTARFKITGGNPGDIIKVVFDAPPVDDATSKSTAGTWLTTPATIDATYDIPYFELVQVDTPGQEWSEWYQFDINSDGIRRMDFLAEQLPLSTYTISVESA